MFEVLFFDNGSTACFEGEKQVTELQEPWFMLYVKFLEEKGIDPLDGIYHLPDGSMAEVFKTNLGYSWRPLIHENTS